jgi:hypothetical protein
MASPAASISVEQIVEWDDKQDVISDLATIRKGAALGATALQGSDTSDELDDVETNTYVKYVAQTLTEEQKAQVRKNIGAESGMQSYTEVDPIFTASAAYGISNSDINNWNNKTSNEGTITGIKMNGTIKGSSGIVDLGTIITSHQDISHLATKQEVSEAIAEAITNTLNTPV